MARLRLLGGARLEHEPDAGADSGTRRHSLALLALLACAPARSLSRGKLVGLLWPDSPEQAGRNRLSTHVHRLRAELGGSALISEGDAVRLDTEAVECDVRDFETALEEGDPARAVAVYGGPFLDGFYLRGSTEFERWSERQRERLERDWRGALEALAQEAEARGELEVAAGWWRERVRDDPYDSRVALCLMRTLAAAGNRAEALRVARAHARILEEDLGVDRDEETSRLVQELEASTTRAAPDLPAVAVLPFEVLGDDEESAVFAAGLHHDLLTRLSRVDGLTVISRASVLRYAAGGEGSGPEPLRQVVRELGVETVVQGSLRRSAGRIRLNLELIDAPSERLRWADTYDRELTATDLLDLQSELAGRVAGSLRAELNPVEKARLQGRRPAGSIEAYRSCMQGRARLDERTPEGITRATEHFRRAIASDPDYALAHVGLADALTLGYSYGHAEGDAVLAEASSAAHRALELDPSLGEAWASLAIQAEAVFEGPRAIRNLWRAVGLRPGYADAHNWLSWNYLLLGRGEDALSCATRAVELNPLAPEAVANLALSNLANDDAAKALSEARRVIELEPDWNSGHFLEGLALHHLERFDEAERVLRDLPVPWAGHGPAATRALARAATGDRPETRERAHRFESEGAHFAAGLLHAALGDTDRAFGQFERVRTWGFWPALAVHHFYPRETELLRRSSRFPSLLEALHRGWGLEPDGSFPRDAERAIGVAG